MKEMKQALEARVWFVCILEGLELAQEISKAISPLTTWGCMINPSKGQYHCVLDFSPSDFAISENAIRWAMSKAEACYVTDVRLTLYNLPVLTRPRKSAGTQLLCECEELFCKHVPRLSEAELFKIWARDAELMGLLFLKAQR
jgi:hypothetical protein